MSSSYCYKEVVPFIAMVAAECSTVVLNTFFKAASAKGLSYYVFIVYSYALATLVLLPFLFIFRSTARPPSNSNKLSLFIRLIFLGILGLLSQICGYKGLEYSSPTLASAISNLTPAFTFILAVILRMEKLALKRSSTQAKLIGTAVSISGALVIVLYKGPVILSNTAPSQNLSLIHHLSSSNWVLGGLLFASQCLILSIWYILQTQVMKIYPAEFPMVFLYYLFTTIISLPVCLLAETNLSAWKLRADITLVTIVYSGFLGQSFITVIHSWGLRLKGPVYITSFKPLSIAIAATTGVLFLGDALYLGSIVGAMIISIGFYALMWGRAKEEEMNEEYSFDGLESPLNGKTPFLQSYKVQDM